MTSSATSEEKLPSNLSNIVSQYENSANYLTLSNTNPLAKTQILADELSNVSLDLILQFKLATQLATIFEPKYQNYLIELTEDDHLEEIPVSRPDPQTLIGIFLPLLKVYPYEFLFSDDILTDLPHPIRIKTAYDMYERYDSILRYIESEIINQEAVIKATLTDTNYIFSLMDPKYKYRLVDILKYTEPQIISFFNTAYYHMIHGNGLDEIFEHNAEKYQPIYTTVSISNYIPLFEKYITWILIDRN